MTSFELNSVTGLREAIREVESLADNVGYAALASSLNRVGGKARTQIRRQVAAELGIGRGKTKHIRARVQSYRATRRKLRTKIWHGLERPLRFHEFGPALIARGPPGSRVRRVFRPGRRPYVGVFYEDPAGKLREVTASLEPAVNRLALPLTLAQYDADFVRTFERELEWRLTRRRGWRRG